MRPTGSFPELRSALLRNRVAAAVTRQTQPRPPVVFRDLGAFGGLGNQLWQIAATMGLAASRGSPARFNQWSYQQHFSVPEESFEEPTEEEVSATSLATHIVEPFRPYLQDYALFRRIERKVRKFFAPPAAARSRMESKFEDLLRIPDKTALHVRRGDYLLLPGNHPVLPVTYYRDAIQRSPGTNLLVFSDDIDWCRRNFEWARPVSFIEGNADYEDLFLIASCQHHILANSSFSWWGAFLSGDRQPIYPTRWYGPSFIALGVQTELMFPRGWIGLDA